MSGFLFVAGFVLALAGGIWLTLTIFKESVVLGLCSLLLPVITLFFVATNWEESKFAFMVHVTGVAMLLASWKMGLG